jgi:UDPglucose 6-dehydrogenase
MKIIVVGLGYVGVANAAVLAQHCEVIGVDVSPQRVALLNARKSPVGDQDLPDFLATGDLNLSATTNLQEALPGSDYVIIATPTNYDEKLNFFDTRSVEDVAAECMQHAPEACLVIKSTIPVGFVDGLRSKLQRPKYFFLTRVFTRRLCSIR